MVTKITCTNFTLDFGSLKSEIPYVTPNLKSVGMRTHLYPKFCQCFHAVEKAILFSGYIAGRCPEIRRAVV